jgi:hypothetical protein
VRFIILCFESRSDGLRLPDNPYQAAEKFLSNNELPMSYVDQVVKFIESNTGGAQLGAASSSAGFVDPFTGESNQLWLNTTC